MTDKEQDISHTAKYNQAMQANAAKATGMGGKRFLGWTPSGAEAWISYNFDRNTKELTVDSTVNLELLLQENARLADARVTVKRNATNRHDVEEMLKFARRSQSGAVTPTTIKYFIKLMSAVNSKFAKAFVNGVPTTTIFQMVTNSIYAGGVEEMTGDFRWSDALKKWDLPKGEYFTWDSLPTVKEE